MRTSLLIFVPTSTYRYIPVHTGTYCYILVHTSRGIYIHEHTDMVMLHWGMYQYIPRQTNTYTYWLKIWFVNLLVPIGTYQYVLVHTSSYHILQSHTTWYCHVLSGTVRYCLVLFSVPAALISTYLSTKRYQQLPWILYTWMDQYKGFALSLFCLVQLGTGLFRCTGFKGSAWYCLVLR